MHLRAPALADPTALLPAADPVAKLGAAVIVMTVAFASRDPVTPAVLLAGEALALAGTGLRPAALTRLLLPVVAVAALLGALNALLAGTSAVLPSDTTADRVALGLALGLRVAAIALAGILALATTDPADLAAALIGHLHVPARLAVGALATLRLVPILGIEWQSIGLARRARGVDAGRNPLVAARLGLTALVILLVSTIRRAARLALAMDARGFDSGTPRTLARPPRMRRADWLLLLAAAALGAAAVTISVAVGSWAFIFGRVEDDGRDMARDVELSITAGADVLAGTLALPDVDDARGTDRRWPAVLLLPSLLPRDRDGHFDRGQHRGWFAPEPAGGDGLLARLAAALATRGVASLRVDKRGCGRSGGEWSTAGLFTLVDDARDAVSVLRGHDAVDPSRIGLVGHGEGAWLALSVAAADPGIGPLTLIGAPARGLRDVLRRAAAERTRHPNGVGPTIPRHPFVTAFDRGLEELVERADRGELEMTLTMAGGRRATLGLAGWEQALRIPTRALATLQRRSVTLVHGEADEWVHRDESALLVAALANGAAPRRILVPGAGHDLAAATPDLLREVAADLAARLQPRRLPTVLLSIGLR